SRKRAAGQPVEMPHARPVYVPSQAPPFGPETPIPAPYTGSEVTEVTEVTGGPESLEEPGARTDEPYTAGWHDLGDERAREWGRERLREWEMPEGPGSLGQEARETEGAEGEEGTSEWDEPLIAAEPGGPGPEESPARLQGIGVLAADQAAMGVVWAEVLGYPRSVARRRRAVLRGSR
ncbi:MAG: hypothetical protein NUW23_06905, partial [Firmicutes bacterium]|nr:hypothetical protein [Bacillota bacterium]